jgi:hypothetical protein
LGNIPLNSSKGRPAASDAATHAPSPPRQSATIFFARRDLDRILWLYGRMVAAGELRDYAIDGLNDRCVFSMFRRASEMPLYQIEMRPALARKQGAFALIGAQGQVLKRGAEAADVLAVLERKLLKIAD